MLKSNQFFHALDLGSSEFKLARQKKDGFANSESERVSVKANGMRRGMLANFEQALNSLNQLIDLASLQFGYDIEEVILGVAGSHLAGFSHIAEVFIQNKCVSTHDVANLKQKVKSALNDKSRYVVDIAAGRYQIDNREWLADPRSFSGSQLRGKFFVVTGDSNYLGDLVTLANHAGIRVKEFASLAIQGALLTVPLEKRNQGALFLDIGAGQSKGVIFIEGKVEKIFTINIGGALFTSDLSLGLAVDLELSERTKHLSEAISCSSFTHELKAKWILGARALELARLVKNESQDYIPLLASGVYLTGGGSLLKGLEHIMAKELGLLTQKIAVKDRFAKESAVLGLLAKEGESLDKTPKQTSPFLMWFKELL